MTLVTPFRLVYQRTATLLLTVGLCLSAATSLQAQPLLTLEEAIQIALKHNADIRIAQGGQKIAAKNYHLGNAGFLPKLDVHVRGDMSHPILSTNNAFPSLSPDLKLTWNIFSGLQHLYTYQNLGTLHRISQLRAQQTTAQQVAAVIKGYYALVLAQQKQQVLEKALVVAQKNLALAQAQYQAGTGTQLDYLTAQVQYNTEQAQLLAHQEALMAAQMTLQELLGYNSPQDFAVATTIPLAAKLTWETLTKDWATTSVELLTTQQQCREAALAVKLQKAKLWPRVDFLCGYKLHSQYQNHDWNNVHDGLYYGLSVSLNLFDAFQHHTAIQVARIQEGHAQLRSAATKRKIEAKMKQCYLRYTQLLQRYEMAQHHVQVSEQSAALALAQYQAGKITFLTLNKAEQDAQKTVLQQLQVAYETKSAEVELLQLAGRLLDESLLIFR